MATRPQAVALYRAEPYVVAADVYAVAPHTGRGGWTWYTGSAGWMYRLIVESLLGMRREAQRLSVCAAPSRLLALVRNPVSLRGNAVSDHAFGRHWQRTLR